MSTLEELRLSTRLSQYQLCYAAGIPEALYSRYESGEDPLDSMPIGMLLKLCRFFNLSTEDLLERLGLLADESSPEETVTWPYTTLRRVSRYGLDQEDPLELDEEIILEDETRRVYLHGHWEPTGLLLEATTESICDLMCDLDHAKTDEERQLVLSRIDCVRAARLPDSDEYAEFYNEIKCSLAHEAQERGYDVDFQYVEDRI